MNRSLFNYCMHADNYKGEAKAFFVNISVWRAILTESIYSGQNEANFSEFFPGTNKSAFL